MIVLHVGIGIPKIRNFLIKYNIMEESKRQKQVAQLVMEEMSEIFQREGYNVVDGGMVSISKVAVTPDLLEARIYLSLFQIKDTDKLMATIKERTWDLRKQLGQRVKNQLRRVPELVFYNDDTLDYVFKMEEIFKKINDERNTSGNTEK
jgi:ribosome-binding factor A